ncbi:ABC transporter permease [Marinoscillum luteum]|uniref:ABC transporter permease n=1 Tax=Marinoscillum luteum TaxID=861051 RepID=A0ABW7NCW9_9BACT
MIYNMLKVSWRMATRKTSFTLLNIIGLSVGMMVCLLVGLYVHYEYAFDAFHEKSDRIYRINQSMIWGDWASQMPTTGPNVALALKADVPEIEAITRILHPEGFVVTSLDEASQPNSFLEDDLLIADADFFKIFSFPMVEGDKSSALSKPNQIVITEKAAIKYFGKESALGKTLQLRGTILEGRQEEDNTPLNFTISGIIEDIPDQSHIQFDMVASAASFIDITQNESLWTWTAFANYALLKKGVDAAQLESALKTIPPKWAASTLQRIFGLTFDELHADNKSWDLFMQPIGDVYLGSNTMGNILGPLGQRSTIASFTAIGLLILILSSINFMNLSTAQSSNRAREVGIRKALGAQRKALIAQFLFEAFFLVVISTLVGIALTGVLLDSFNHFSGKSINLFEQLSQPIVLITIIVFCGFLGLLAGSYPALYLSSFQPANGMKGILSMGISGKGIRNALIVFQFTISIGLIIGSVFIARQLNYMTQFDLGYDKEHVLQLHNVEQFSADSQVLKNTLMSQTGIQLVGEAHQSPPNVMRGNLISARLMDKDQMEVSRMKVDAPYLDLLDVALITGRNFNETMVTDLHHSVILNAEAVQMLGWGTPEDYSKESPVGKYIYSNGQKMEVIGVTADFYYKSPKHQVEPLVIYHIDNKYLPDSGTSPSVLSLRIDPNAIHSTNEMSALVASIRDEVKNMDPYFPFEYSFLDQEFENSFRNEQRVKRIMNAFTLMALIIACIGLYGLAIFSAEKRTKELGIRKLLGASVLQIVTLFSRDFTKLIVIGFLIASPIAWYFVDTWLSKFPYRTSINLWVFALAGAAGLLISWITIGLQSVKVATKNPVEALRDE